MFYSAEVPKKTIISHKTETVDSYLTFKIATRLEKTKQWNILYLYLCLASS